MWEFITGPVAQRLVIISGIGGILSTMEVGIDDFRFWAVFILLFILEFISKNEGIQIGSEHLLGMSRAKLLEVKDFMDSVARGNDHSPEELKNILKKDRKDVDE